MPRKRARAEADLDVSLIQDERPRDDERLRRLRSMWQFANFVQYVNIFHKAVKLQDLSIEDFEETCLDQDKQSKLADIGLTLLKYVSSHRGLTPQIFDEYTRRQFTAKAPHRNPYGEDEVPKSYADFDVFTKIKVLQQLSVWTLGNADRIRGLMDENESGMLLWRIEPFGWDADGNSYFVLDDNRLYKQVDPPIPSTPVKPKPKASKSKAKSKKTAKPRSKPTRSSKRIKLSTPEPEPESEEDEDEDMSTIKHESVAAVKVEDDEDDGLGGATWECIAVTMDDYQEFLEKIRRSRDPDEKVLHKRIVDNVLPILEQRAQERNRELLKKQREWENEQRMMTAKRSTRIAGKMEKQKEEEEARILEEKRIADLKMAHKEQERQTKMDEARKSRMQTREQRLREREVKRILHEEELTKLAERKANGDDEEARHSSRNLQNEMERRQKELAELKEEEDKWIFDCAGCGMYGENIDDGTHSIACERCDIWQHSKCNGIKESDAEREDFKFICSDCKRKEEDAKKPKIPPLKLGRIGTSSSPQTEMSEIHGTSNGINGHSSPTGDVRIVEGVSLMNRKPPSQSPGNLQLQEAPSLSPSGDRSGYDPRHRIAAATPQPVWQTSSVSQLGRLSQPPNTTQIQQPFNHHQIHQQAHSAALSHAGLYDGAGTSTANGHGHGLGTAYGGPTQQDNRPGLPLNPYMHVFSAARPASNATNGHRPSPAKKQATPSPSAQRHRPLSSPLAASQRSPNVQLSPPPSNARQQRLAGQSPTKQPSPSPPPPYHRRTGFLQSSPSMPPPSATPAAQIVPTGASPSMSLLRASPQAASSPIPPVGSGPVIPQKHDPAPQGIDNHIVGGTPVFPPKTSLSPSRTQLEDGKGMGTQAGAGGLGTGTVPVKRMPGSPILPPAQPAGVGIRSGSREAHGQKELPQE